MFIYSNIKLLYHLENFITVKSFIWEKMVNCRASRKKKRGKIPFGIQNKEWFSSKQKKLWSVGVKKAAA